MPLAPQECANAERREEQPSQEVAKLEALDASTMADFVGEKAHASEGVTDGEGAKDADPPSEMRCEKPKANADNERVRDKPEQNSAVWLEIMIR